MKDRTCGSRNASLKKNFVFSEENSLALERAKFLLLHDTARKYIHDSTLILLCEGNEQMLNTNKPFV